MMLALFVALAVTAPTAVEATGMEPQLRIIREAAAERRWPITCVGHDGEQGVVRIGVPAGTSREVVDGFIQSISSVASEAGDLGLNARNETCDREPVRMEASPPVRQLLFIAGQPEPRFLAVAKECGFSRAYWRATSDKDVAALGGALDIKKYSTVLDAGENTAARYGPTVCFMKMRPHLPRAESR